ncbi:hypothetical protein TorRG33x02_063190, partial [Trema orientale]
VILSTIATKPLRCNHWWIPFVLSLLAAILNFVPLCHTILAFVKCSEELDQNWEYLRIMTGKKLTMAQLFDQQNPVVRQKPDTVTRIIRRGFSIFGIALFVGFSVVILYGCYSIHC